MTETKFKKLESRRVVNDLAEYKTLSPKQAVWRIESHCRTS